MTLKRTIVAAACTNRAKDDGGCFIGSVRFKIDEIDALANASK